MNAKFEIPEKQIKLDLENATLNTFIIIGRGTNPSDNGETLMKFPVGKPIVIITSNMPEDLKKDIDEIISNYCNH